MCLQTCQGRREPSPGLEWQGLAAFACAEDLDTHVVSACVMVCSNAARDCLLVAAGYQGVREPIAAATREVIITEAQPTKIAYVVRQQKVGRDE
jgi:hypothetical protein